MEKKEECKGQADDELVKGFELPCHRHQLTFTQTILWFGPANERELEGVEERVSESFRCRCWCAEGRKRRKGGKPSKGVRASSTDSDRVRREGKGKRLEPAISETKRGTSVRRVGGGWWVGVQKGCVWNRSRMGEEGDRGRRARDPCRAKQIRSATRGRSLDAGC